METLNSSERTHFWEELLKDKYEENKVEEFNALGKGKRNRKLVCGGGGFGHFLILFCKKRLLVLLFTYKFMVGYIQQCQFIFSLLPIFAYDLIMVSWNLFPFLFLSIYDIC